MSRFADGKLNRIAPYVPGEQPKEREYIKLNTNENPYFLSKSAQNAVTQEVLANLRRYSDPDATLLRRTIADYYRVSPENVLATNGSDEALAFAFRAYGANGVCFPDVTYGFYSVLADLYDCPAERIALKEDFTVDVRDYFNKGKTVVIANPNAQTGIALSYGEIEKIVAANRDNVVIVDQAYVDFGGENVIPLTERYENLLVVNTFSKSRSLAGARVGFVVGNAELIADLNRIRYSFHPYNVNTVSMLLAKYAMEDEEYFRWTVDKIKRGRDALTARLQELGFRVLPSSANFVMAASPRIGGGELYRKLKDAGVLVRYFDEARIDGFVRITVGLDEENESLVAAIAEILKEKE